MSFVRVDRLTRGEVTILQEGTEDVVVFDELGVNCQSDLSREHINAIARNVEVWAPADPEPRGIVKWKGLPLPRCSWVPRDLLENVKVLVE